MPPKNPRAGLKAKRSLAVNPATGVTEAAKREAPWGAGRERQGRQKSDTAVGRGWVLPPLPRVGRGDCPDDPPRRVAGSGNSRDRYPARGRGGAKRTQLAMEKHTHKAYISKIMIIGYCR